MNAYQAGLFCAAAYPPAPARTFQYFFASDTVTVGVGIDELGEQVFAFAGSRDPRDFVDDAFAIRVHIDGIGHVHAGFWAGMEDMFNANLRPLIAAGKPFSAVGHSLGAPHAAMFVALCARAGIRAKSLWMIEPPRPGFADFGERVRTNCDLVWACRNARDPVVDVPLTLLGLEFEHIVPLVDLTCPAPGIDPFSDHMLEVVIPGLKRWQDAQLEVA
jgi:hypothetical protein